jgi:hypothetical protein
MQSSFSVTTGGNNTYLGYQAGYTNATGSGNVSLGYQAGYSETGSNKLYIANSNTATPLIYGDFSTPALTINGSLTLPLTRKLNIATGTNAIAGTATLAAGTVTVSTTAVTASSIILLTVQSLGTVTVASALSVGTKTAATSFVINSAVLTDTSVIGWLIIN